MLIQTTWLMNKPPEQVWPLLCDSRMDNRQACLFRLGVPKPVACRLPEGQGGVGQRRQCVSEQGIVEQRITHWEPARLLRFQMEDSNLFFRPCVTSMQEEFRLEPVGHEQTRITRTTRLAIRGIFPRVKGLLMWLGLKRVHRYVFANWAKANSRSPGVAANEMSV